MAEAAAQAWKAAGEVEPSSVGIVSVTSGGPLIYSRRFFDSFSQKGRKFASPAIFPETVFNASASHVASMLGIEGACYTLVGDASAFVTALEIAAVWLKRSEVSHVLVVASEEIDEVMLNAYRLVGWTRKRSPGLFSEGAGAIMLRRPCKGDDRMLVGIADTVGFRNPTTALEAAERCLKTFPAGIPVFPTASLPWQVSLEDKILARRPRCDCTTDLPLFGDAGSAGTAWHFIRAWAQLDRVQRLVMPVWGLNHQIGAVQLQHSHEDQQVR